MEVLVTPNPLCLLPQQPYFNPFMLEVAAAWLKICLMFLAGSHFVLTLLLKKMTSHRKRPTYETGLAVCHFDALAIAPFQRWHVHCIAWKIGSLSWRKVFDIRLAGC